MCTNKLAVGKCMYVCMCVYVCVCVYVCMCVCVYVCMCVCVGVTPHTPPSEVTYIIVDNSKTRNENNSPIPGATLPKYQGTKVYLSG